LSSIEILDYPKSVSVSNRTCIRLHSKKTKEDESTMHMVF
jgi:hypothetical protein